MPNWADTTYVFYGAQDELEELQNQLSLATVKEHGDYCTNGSFVNILNYFGLDCDAIPCRGHIIDDPWFDRGFLVVETETAWGPCLDYWEEILQRWFPNVEYVYQSIEMGCGVYVSSDVNHIYFKNKYHLHDEKTGNGWWFDNDRDLIETVKSLVGRKRIRDVEEAVKAIEKFNAKNRDYIDIFEIEFM